MTAWVILFRGVGGATRLPVGRLKDSLSSAGFDRVATYINSGNAVLTSPLTREGVIQTVSQACSRDLGFTKAVHALTREEWAELVARNPFPGAVTAPTTLHAAVLAAAPDPARVAALQALGRGHDRIEVVGEVAYLHTPDGFGRSKLGERFDKGIGVANTARNWNTVARLMTMADAANQSDGVSEA